MNHQCFSFHDIVDVAATAGASSADAMPKAVPIFLDVLWRAAPLWLVLCHPERPVGDARRLIDAIDKLYARGFHGTIRQDSCLPEKDDADGDVEGGPVLQSVNQGTQGTTDAPGTAPVPPPPASTASTASKTPTVTVAAEDEETRLILALLDAHTQSAEEVAAVTTSVPEADHTPENKGTDQTGTTPLSPPSPPQAMTLVGTQTAQAPISTHWSFFFPRPTPTTSSSPSSLPQSRLARTAVASITLELLRRSPSWYTSLLHPSCEAVLNDRLTLLTEASAQTSESAESVLTQHWYAQSLTHNTNTDPPMTPLCFVLAPSDGLIQSGLSRDVCTSAVNRLCAEVRAVQQGALVCAAERSVDRRVPSTLPALVPPSSSRPEKRPRADDGGTASAAALPKQDSSGRRSTGLTGWAASLKAEASAMTRVAREANLGTGHGTSRREVWVEEVVSAMPHGMGCILLLPASTASTSSASGDQLRAAVALSPDVSTFLLVS